MLNLNLLKIFVKVAELGSFTQASKALKFPKSRISRAIARLEEDLEFELIRRSTRQTSLTSNGLDFYNKIKPLIHQLDEQINFFTSNDNQISGQLRITAPEDIGQVLVPIVAKAYMKKYPLVQLETIITNDVLDLTKENIDIAFRVGSLKSSTQIQKKLGQVGIIFVASPKYLKEFGTPQNLNDLEKHNFLSFSYIKNKNLFMPFKNKGKFEIKPNISSNSFPVLLKLAVDGNGITPLPGFYCRPLIEEGKLIQVFTGYQSSKSNVHLVCPSSKLLPLRTSAFIDTAAELIPGLLL